MFSASVSVIYLTLPLFSVFILEPSEAEALGLADEILAVVRPREAGPGPGVLGLTSGPNKEKMSLGGDKSSSSFFGIIIYCILNIQFYAGIGSVMIMCVK